MNEMDQILMREHHLENETLSLKAKGLFSIMLLQEFHCPQFGRTEPGWDRGGWQCRS